MALESMGIEGPDIRQRVIETLKWDSIPAALAGMLLISTG